MKENLLPCLLAPSALQPFSHVKIVASLETVLSSPGPVVEMEPYIVKGERVLPNPESWFYINIPAVEIKRGGRVIHAPGYEILSSRNRQNSLVLAGELQLRQVANALVFPDFVGALPRSAVIVALDDGRLRGNTRAKIWEGDSLYTATALRESGEQPDLRYSIGTQVQTHFAGDFVTELPSQYDMNTNREMPDRDDDERAGSVSANVASLVGIASNGGPLTVYLDDTRDFAMSNFVPMRGAGSFSYAERPWQRAPGSLLRDNRMDENGIVSESAFGRELSQRLVILARQISSRNDPGWLSAGFGYLCRGMQVSSRQVEFGEFPKYVGSRIVPPKLVEILNGERHVASIRNGTLMAALFVHYCLYGGKEARQVEFFGFLNRLGNEPFSETLFLECFGKKVSEFESDVIVHWHLMTSKKRLIYQWETPPLPGIVIRTATQSEVARLKAEMLIARGRSPKALDELRIAYWRGERDPWMLALLALLEEHIGSVTRAEKITKSLLAMPRAPARAYVAAAKLRLRELVATDGPDGAKLSREDYDSVMALLAKARERGLLNEDLCATLSRLVMSGTEPPDAELTTFINEAAKRYPLNKTIAAAQKTSGA